MDREKLVQLIFLANRAKNIKIYTLANAIMALLLHAFLNGEAVRDFSHIEWETQDQEGFWGNNEVYYDLIVIEVDDLDGESRGLCIPLPMISLASFFRLAKVARVVTRKEHCRQTRPAEEAEATGLWQEFWALVTPIDKEFVETKVREHLNFEDEQSDAWECLGAITGEDTPVTSETSRW